MWAGACRPSPREGWDLGHGVTRSWLVASSQPRGKTEYSGEDAVMREEFLCGSVGPTLWLTPVSVKWEHSCPPTGPACHRGPPRSACLTPKGPHCRLGTTSLICISSRASCPEHSPTLRSEAAIGQNPVEKRRDLKPCLLLRPQSLKEP